MSKVLTFLLVFVLAIALLCFFTGSSFNLKAYANNLENLPTKPSVPDWSKVSISFDNAETIKDSFQALRTFFVFVGDALAYPFKYIVYLGETVFTLSNGMLEKE